MIDDPYQHKPEDYLYDTYDDHIENIAVTGGIEIGPVNRMYHFHLLLSITHWSRIQFDYFKMSDWFIESFRGNHTDSKDNFPILDTNGEPWVLDSENWYTQLKFWKYGGSPQGARIEEFGS